MEIIKHEESETAALDKRPSIPYSIQILCPNCGHLNCEDLRVGCSMQLEANGINEISRLCDSCEGEFEFEIYIELKVRKVTEEDRD